MFVPVFVVAGIGLLGGSGFTAYQFRNRPEADFAESAAPVVEAPPLRPATPANPDWPADLGPPPEWLSTLRPVTSAPVQPQNPESVPAATITLPLVSRPTPAGSPKPAAPAKGGGTPDAATALDQEMRNALVGVKLAPVEISIGGLDFTVEAPEGAEVSKSSKSAAIKWGSRFDLRIEIGKVDLSMAKDNWKRGDGDKLRSLVLDTEDTLVGESVGGTAAATKTFHRLLHNVSLAHLEFHFENSKQADDFKPFSLRDCLLMLHCARTVDLYRVSTVPDSVHALQRLGAQVETNPRGQVTSLTLADMPCTDATLAVFPIAKLAPTLENLDLSGAVVSDQGLKHLARLTNLRILILPEKSVAPLNGSGLVYLKALTRLEALGLANTAVTDAGLANLKGLTALKALDLRSTRVTGTGFDDFRGFTNLQILNLDDTPFTDAGMKNVQGMTGLRELRLEETEVTDAGLVYLKGLRNLTVLELSGTPVTGTGFAALHGLTEIQSLGLNQSRFEDAGLEHLAGMRKLRSLGLAGTPVTGNGFVHLKTLTQLTDLHLRQSQVNDIGLGQFPGLPLLETLDLSKTNVTDAGLKSLKRLPGLQSLALENTQVAGTGLDGLRGATALRSLQLGGTQVTDDALVYLKACGNLNALELDGTRVGDAGLVHLKGLAKLEALGLSNTQVGDDGLAFLKGLINLRTLGVQNTKVSKAGVAKLNKALPEVLIDYGN